MKYRIKSFYVLLATTVVVAGGCERKARMAAEQRAETAEARLVQMDAISATKDSLMTEMVSTTSFINQMNDELSKVKNVKGQTVKYGERVMPVAEYRANMLARLDSLVQRLQQSESRLKASEARLRKLAGSDKAMTARLAQLDSTIAEYQVVIEQQRGQIASLTGSVDSLHAVTTKLVAEKTELSTQVTDLTNFANRVYYIIGTKKDLLAKGIAAERGGSRIIGIGPKTGKTLVPAPQLDESVFAPIAKNVDFDIALPNPEKKYAIVSPQNINYIEPVAAKDGTFKGKIHITNPDAFWSASKYLIIVEK